MNYRMCQTRVMQRILKLTLLLGSAAIVLCAQPAPSDLDVFLRNHLSFTSLDIGDLERGQIVVKLPPAMEQREVDAFAITRLRVSPDFYASKFQDIVNFKKSENVLQIGKFSNPPKLEDLSSLYLDPTDI